MNDPASRPLKPNAIVAQKISSLNPVLGRRLAAVIGVAGPYLRPTMRPITISTVRVSQLASAPMLFSHLPTWSPTMFNTVARLNPTSDTEIKYAGLSCRCWNLAPKM